MTALHGEGRLRIQPASYFSNPYHNGAIRDDELSVPLSVALNRNDIVNLVTNPQDVPINAPDQRFDINLEYGNDYWLYCLTTSINPRLFVDFGADACVIIHDQSEFRKRLRKAAAAATNESIIREGAAVYLDPLLPPKEIPYVPLTKPFGYSYQQEYRFCWTPFSTQPLTHLDVHLGELEDISELVVLE